MLDLDQPFEAGGDCEVKDEKHNVLHFRHSNSHFGI